MQDEEQEIDSAHSDHVSISEDTCFAAMHHEVKNQRRIEKGGFTLGIVFVLRTICSLFF